jgi:hypothetical protein
MFALVSDGSVSGVRGHGTPLAGVDDALRQADERDPEGVFSTTLKEATWPESTIYTGTVALTYTV